MGTNYDQDPKKVSKVQWCLSYASCDEMIKKGLCNVGLNKLKSLKVAQVKDEMDDDEDDGCEGVCDVAL